MTERYIDEIPVLLSLPFNNALSGTYLFFTAALALNLLFAFIANNPLFESREKHLGVFSPIVLWIAIMAWGIFMRNKVGVSDAPEWPAYVLHLLLFLNLPMVAFATLFANGYRYYSLSVGSLIAWMNYCAYEVAMLAVTGQWG